MKKNPKKTLNEAKVIQQLLANQVINLEKQLVISEDKLGLLKKKDANCTKDEVNDGK